MTTRHARLRNPEFGHEVRNGHSLLIRGHHFPLASTEHIVVQLLLGQKALESGILFLESRESRHIVGSHGGILAAPTLIGLM